MGNTASEMALDFLYKPTGGPAAREAPPSGIERNDRLAMAVTLDRLY